MGESIHKPYMGNGFDRVEEVIRQSKKPEDIAEFYCNGATTHEREYIDWVLTKFSDRYRDEVLELADELRKQNPKDSKLEQETKETI